MTSSQYEQKFANAFMVIIFSRKSLEKTLFCNRINSRSYCYPKPSDLSKQRPDVLFNYMGILDLCITKLLCHCNKSSNEDVKCYVFYIYLRNHTRYFTDLALDGSTKKIVNCLHTFVSKQGCVRWVMSNNVKVSTSKKTYLKVLLK